MEKLSRHTDEELVKLYVEGLNEAFDTLLIRYKDRLFGYILSNVHDEDIANDIFQETFFKVIVSLRKGRYVENGKFYVWLSSIAHNVIVDGFRKQQTSTTLSQLGLYLQAKGTDSNAWYVVVTKQDIDAGTKVPRGTMIAVTFTDTTALD